MAFIPQDNSRLGQAGPSVGPAILTNQSEVSQHDEQFSEDKGHITDHITVHKHALNRLHNMTNSDILPERHGLTIHKDKAYPINETMVRVPVSGKPAHIAKMQLYARGLSDAHHHTIPNK